MRWWRLPTAKIPKTPKFYFGVGHSFAIQKCWNDIRIFGKVKLNTFHRQSTLTAPKKIMNIEWCVWLRRGSMQTHGPILWFLNGGAAAIESIVRARKPNIANAPSFRDKIGRNYILTRTPLARTFAYLSGSVLLFAEAISGAYTRAHAHFDAIISL